MDVQTIAAEIRQKIRDLGKGREELKHRAERKAQTIADYEKALSITVIKLKNGRAFVIGDETIESPPATVTERIARGLCWKERLAMEQAEAEYKNAIVGMESLMAELNGLQSVNRYLAE